MSQRWTTTRPIIAINAKGQVVGARAVTDEKILQDLKRRLSSAIRQRDAWQRKSQRHYGCACALVAVLEHEFAELSQHDRQSVLVAKDVSARMAEPPMA